MKNFIQSGENISLVAPADVLSGAGVLVGSLFGVATADALTGETVTIVRRGVFELPKLSAQAWTVGAKVYWNDTAKECTTVASGNTLVGLAVQVAADPSDTGVVLLDGGAATT
ncbi:DUF2190 family protein [Cribrihabitans pelagius]|uniref:DUF2190 family protein n=1 Tax=Cribrihabitans pelagius TaxID=1765746 RepID=UPI003B5B3485